MVFLGQWGPGVLVGGQGGSVLRAWCSDELGARVVRESAGEGVGGSRRWLLVSGLPAQRSGELGGRVPQGSFRRPGVRRVSAASRLRPGGGCAPGCAAPGAAGRAVAGIKQNGILGRLLRDSWLASAEHLV